MFTSRDAAERMMMSKVMEQDDVKVGMWLCLHSTLHHDRMIQEGGLFGMGGTMTMVKGGWRDESYATPQLVVAVEVPFVVLARTYKWAVKDGNVMNETNDMRFRRYFEVSADFARSSIGGDEFDLLISRLSKPSR